jgi:hypothetical protein
MQRGDCGLISGLCAIAIAAAPAAIDATGGFTMPTDGGGWFYEYQAFFGALIGAAGTVFAGWLAWLAVERQIHAGRRQAESERRQRLITALEIGVTDLMTAANFAKGVLLPTSLPGWLGVWAQPTIPSAMEVHPIFGACLQAHIMDLDGFRRETAAISANGNYANEGHAASYRQHALEFAYRAHLLAAGISKCVSLLERGEPVVIPVLLTEVEVGKVSTDFDIPASDVAYLKALVSDELPEGT